MEPPSVSTWNTLEVAKLVASSLTPLIVAGLGIYVHRLTKRFEHVQWRNQKLVEKRLAIYDDIAPLLNDNLCYFTYVGGWKERTPRDVVESKRAIDKRIHLASPLFSPRFFTACMTFQSLCFETYTGWGESAKLRTQTERRRAASKEAWESSWQAMFSEAVTEPAAIREAYLDIMRCFTDEIGINDSVTPPPPGLIPAGL